MNAHTQNTSWLNIVLVLIFVTAIIALCGGITVWLAAVAPDILGGFLATILLTAAIILMMKQKRFSLPSVFLILSATAFLVGAVIQNQYDTIVRPLPVLSQIEFSKIMRPAQVSRGFSNIGMGLLYMLMPFAGFQSKRLSEKYSNRQLQFFKWFLLVMGILFTIMGIDSIVDGLSKLQI